MLPGYAVFSTKKTEPMGQIIRYDAFPPRPVPRRRLALRILPGEGKAFRWQPHALTDACAADTGKIPGRCRVH